MNTWVIGFAGLGARARNCAGQKKKAAKTNVLCIGGRQRKLEDRLHLGDEATLILSSSEVDGRIVAFVADVHNGYEITIESQKPQ